MEFLSADPVLAVHDLDAAAEWFRSVLGCDITEPDPGNWTFCAAGPVTFRLGRCPDALPAAQLGDHSYLAYLTVDCVDTFYRRAVSEQAEVIKVPTTEPWGRREMGLRSPEGHRFMLSERVEPASGR
ncbi:VOC family protein [Mycobacterium sp. E1747]|uniref:VOC family protein n=1 Tax=Mycobacterium sp. E1747 TaxID=1834128 RepID=UPI00080017ED|nr:VOC family protein [Mycobacterium sp. E1747]OBH02880.1 hypothetical protein A5695_10590 [Mycobacterium sp. E1747]